MARNEKQARAATTAAPLEISVTNFGPLSKGTFRIAPLTIFVGPNGSGKTYASLLAHSVLSCLSSRASPWSLAALIDGRLKSPEFRRLVSSMDSLAASAASGRRPVPPGLTRQVCALVGAHFVRALASTIEGNFGVGLASLVRAGARSSTIRISGGGIVASLTLRKGGSHAGGLEFPGAKYTITAGAGQIAVYEHKGGDRPRDVYLHDASAEGRAKHTLDILGMPENRGLGAVVALFVKIEQLFLSRSMTSYYLPAGRSGILSTYDMLLSNIINGMKYGEEGRDATITGTMSDFVNFFRNVPAQRPPDPKRGKSAVGEMFGGRLVLSRPRFAPTRIMYRFNGTEIPISRASSGVAETAPFELFQCANARSDVLVFEEPEAHLHPANQARLAKHVARLVNDGTHVILSTHSVHFLEQLSLLLKMSRLTPGQRQKMKYGPNDFLNNDDVCPYVFKADTKGGHVIREVKHSVADGISQDEFVHTIECMYEEDMKVEQEAAP